LPQAAAQRFGVQLFPQGVQASPRGDKAAFADDGPAAGSLAPVVQAETGAGANPVPAFRFLPLAAQGLAPAPAISFPNVPGIQLNNHLAGVQRQFQLILFGGGLPIEFSAQGQCPFPLPTRFPVQGGSGQFDARQVFQHRAGIFDGHFAGQQRGHVLHGGRIAGAFLQAQDGVGGHTPLATVLAIATGALDGDGTKARLKGADMPTGKPAQFMPAHRTCRRCRVGFGLCPALDGLAQQLLNVLSGLALHMAQVLVAGQNQTLYGLFQSTRRTGGQYRQRFGWSILWQSVEI
jgi:hypothetical protein